MPNAAPVVARQRCCMVPSSRYGSCPQSHRLHSPPSWRCYGPGAAVCALRTWAEGCVHAWCIGRCLRRRGHQAWVTGRGAACHVAQDQLVCCVVTVFNDVCGCVRGVCRTHATACIVVTWGVSKIRPRVVCAWQCCVPAGVCASPPPVSVVVCGERLFARASIHFHSAASPVSGFSDVQFRAVVGACVSVFPGTLCERYIITGFFYLDQHVYRPRTEPRSRAAVWATLTAGISGSFAVSFAAGRGSGRMRLPWAAPWRR